MFNCAEPYVCKVLSSINIYVIQLNLSIIDVVRFLEVISELHL